MKMNNQELVSELPQEFNVFMEHLLTLRYLDRPNYAFLHKTLNDLFQRLGGDENTPFDWERERVVGPRRPRGIPKLADLAFLQVASHVDSYPSIRLSPPAQKRLIQFLIRCNEGDWKASQLERILHSAMTELDLERCAMNEECFQRLVFKCPSLTNLRLGAVSDLELKELLSKYGEFLQELAFSSHRLLTVKGYKSISELCPLALTSVTIRDDKLTDKGLEYLLRGCTNLASLNLAGCRKIKGAAFKPFTGKKRLLLKKLDLSECELGRSGFRYLYKVGEPLEALVMSPLLATFKIVSSDFVLLLQSCPRLVHLELINHQFEMDSVLVEIARGCTQFTTLLLDGLSMTDQSLSSVAQSCNQLRTLKFRYGDGVTDASLTQIARNCNLDSLTLDFWNRFNRLSVSDHGIKTLLQACGNLKSLSLCSCLILTGACFPETVYFPLLHSLNLADCIQLNDFAIRRITESCPNLLSLCLSNINNLTATSLDAIGLSCLQLEDLNLQQCTCFPDDPMSELLHNLPKLFLTVTRFTDADLRGVTKEVHFSNVARVFAEYPNTYRERAYDRTRRRMYGMGP